MATGQLIDEDPAGALAHALAARRLASRISSVREAVGLAAYHAGEWQSAIAELRTYHRMSGSQNHLAVIADSERALGRPERAIDLFRGADQEKLDPAVAIELLIVAAGARGDLGQRDAAVAMLQVPDLTSETIHPWTARLRYAYADALLAVGRRTEAREWFSRAAEVDTEAETDAAERLLDLDGVVIEGDDADEAAEALADGSSTSDDGEDAPGDESASDDVTGDDEAGDDAAEEVEPGGDEPAAVEERTDDRPNDDQPADSGATAVAQSPEPADGEQDPVADLDADRRAANGIENPEAR